MKQYTDGLTVTAIFASTRASQATHLAELRVVMMLPAVLLFLSLMSMGACAEGTTVVLLTVGAGARGVYFPIFTKFASFFGHPEMLN